MFNTGLTDVHIANLALSKLGARSRLQSMQENSPEGEQVRLWYDISRAQTLQAYPWSFAKKRAALVEHTDGPGVESPWSMRYYYTTDSLVFRYIENPLGPEADAIPFTTEKLNGVSTILTDVEDAYGYFTLDVEDVLQYPPMFIDAFAACLAWHIALPITGSQNIATDMANQFRYLIRVAAANDANEQVSRPPREAEGIRARY